MEDQDAMKRSPTPPGHRMSLTSDGSTGLATSTLSRSSSKILLPRPDSSVLPEVVATTDKEVFFADEKQAAGAGEKQVVKELNLPQAIDDESWKEVVGRPSSPSSQEGPPPARNHWNRRVKWTLAAICLTVLLAIGLGVGLDLGLKLKRTSSSSTPTPSSPQASAQAIGGSSANPTYYSTEGAFNGTGLALAQQSNPGLPENEGVIVLYFQHHTGQIRYMQLNSTTGEWSGGYTSTIVATDAKNSTPIYAVSYVAPDYSSEWHVFCRCILAIYATKG